MWPAARHTRIQVSCAGGKSTGRLNRRTYFKYMIGIPKLRFGVLLGTNYPVWVTTQLASQSLSQVSQWFNSMSLYICQHRSRHNVTGSRFAYFKRIFCHIKYPASIYEIYGCSRCYQIHCLWYQRISRYRSHGETRSAGLETYTETLVKVFEASGFNKFTIFFFQFSSLKVVC